MSLEEIESDILEAQRRLESLVPVQKCWTFAYPCYQDYVGRGAKRQSYVPIVARHFIAARGLGRNIANSPFACDLHYLWGWPVERMRGDEMVGLVERAVSQDRWGILTIHGINEGHLPVSEVDFTELLEFLDRNRNRIWTAPVIEVAQHIIRSSKQSNNTTEECYPCARA